MESLSTDLLDPIAAESLWQPVDTQESILACWVAGLQLNGSQPVLLGRGMDLPDSFTADSDELFTHVAMFVEFGDLKGWNLVVDKIQRCCHRKSVVLGAVTEWRGLRWPGRNKFLAALLVVPRSLVQSVWQDCLGGWLPSNVDMLSDAVMTVSLVEADFVSLKDGDRRLPGWDFNELNSDIRYGDRVDVRRALFAMRHKFKRE